MLFFLLLFLSPELPSSTCRKYPLSFQKLEFVKKVQNSDVAIESKEAKTPIKEIKQKSPSKHVAIKNEDTKSISHARNLASMYGWENADPPKKIKSMVKDEKKRMATTIQKSINPTDLLENEVLATPNVLNVAVERSKEEGDHKAVDSKHESDAIERAEAKDEEERLLLKAKRKERKKQKKANKKEAQAMNFATDSNVLDSFLVAMKENGSEGAELAAEQTTVISSQQEQGVSNSQPYSEKTTMGTPPSSILERTIRKLFPPENTLVVSCNVAFIGVVLSMCIYIAVKFIEIS